ncbi:resistance to Congo red protein [Streptomyces canus]
MASAKDGVTLAYKGLGAVPTWAIIAIIAFVVLWVLVSTARRNRR